MRDLINRDIDPDLIEDHYAAQQGVFGGPQAGRVVGSGGLSFVGYTQSAAAPALAQYPENKNWGFHKDTTGPTWYLVFNAAGVIKKVALT